MSDIPYQLCNKKVCIKFKQTELASGTIDGNEVDLK